MRAIESHREPKRARKSQREPERVSKSQREPKKASESLREPEITWEPERARSSQGENHREPERAVKEGFIPGITYHFKRKAVCCKTFRHGTFCHKHVFYMLRAGEKMKI